MSEQWTRENCPQCGEDNWVCLGDLSDLTGVDVDGIECRSCGHEWLFEGMEDCVSLEDANLERGREKP